MPYYECECTNCHNLNDITDSHCNNCGFQLPGTINTRRASIKEEVSSLENRYQKAISNLKTDNLQKEATELTDEVNSNGKAVINTSIEFLWKWLVVGTHEYVSYRRQIIDNSRPTAKFENDVMRSFHDSILFGSTNDIIYSALSIDEHGLISYGEATLILKTSSIENRTSALETNSFFFVKKAIKDGWKIDEPLPPGFMSTWFTKDKLCLSKLEKKLKTGLKKEELARLVLTSNGNRVDDEFVELYIFGKIVGSSLEKIKIPSDVKTSADPKTRSRLLELERKYKVEYY